MTPPPPLPLSRVFFYNVPLYQPCGETWSPVGGRYFGLSGSVVCLSGSVRDQCVRLFFPGVIVWCREVSRDRGGAPQWEERTDYTAYMWLVDC